MATRPPIPWGLTPEEELREFERLKPRLADLWKEVFPHDDQAYTSVIVPSISVDPAWLARRPDAHFFEEVLLFLLIRLRNPRARVVYVMSEPLAPAILDYYLQFLAGIPASHAVGRLTLVSPHDRSPRPLTRKVLERPRLVERIRAAIPDPARAYLTVFRATPLERRLAVLLGIPLNAADPDQQARFTASAARRCLREAGVEVPEGREDLRDEADLLEALGELRRRKPGLSRAVVRLNVRPWDEDTAVIRFPLECSNAVLARRVRRITPAVPEKPGAYLDRFRRCGGLVEEFVEGVGQVASGQVRINPRGQVILTSTHDEIRCGPEGQLSAGCRFPAGDRHRLRVQEASERVGRVLAGKGLVSRLSITFLVLEAGPGAGPGASPRLLGTDVNLGVGGSTHPLLAIRFLTGGRLDPGTGLFLAPSGRPKFYRATDNLGSPAYRGLTPEDLIEILTLHRLSYSPRDECGVLFYMLGGVSELGRVGMVAIGNSRQEAEEVFSRTAAILDRESATPPGAPRPGATGRGEA
jgi:hypothetical protein